MSNRFAEAFYRQYHSKLIEIFDQAIDIYCDENNISRDDLNKQVSDHYNEEPTLTPEELDEYSKRYIVATSLIYQIPIRYLVNDEAAEEIEKWKKENEDLINDWKKEIERNI